MNTVLEKIRKMGIVPVVVIENEKDAVPLADALCNGGLACAEVTFRTAAAGEAIRLMKEAHPEMLVGAGTVLTVDQVDRAVQAGAEFIVSPGFDPEMAAPYTSLSFMPTGGINPENVKKYLEYDRIFACGGSWMVKGKLITEGRFDEIEKLTREAAEIVKNIRG